MASLGSLSIRGIFNKRYPNFSPSPGPGIVFDTKHLSSRRISIVDFGVIAEVEGKKR